MNKVKYICTQGFTYLCDIKPECISNNRMIYTNFNLNNNYGDVIYLHADMVNNFINDFLNKMLNPFVVLIGGNDFTFPDDYSNSNLLIENEKVIKIFAQNSIINNNKVENLPIGLDYHSLYFYNGKHDWSDIISPIDPVTQENQIVELKKIFINIEDTLPIAITNFHLAMNSPPRREKFRKPIYDCLKTKNCIKWLDKQTRTKFWETMNLYTFVLCPFGNGLDTHRAWEVLCLGRIPIIQKSPLNKVYNNLPVIEVDDWSCINEEFLISKKNEIINNIKLSIYNFDILTIEYWKKQLLNYKN
jgi:hypothetical protein